MVSRLSLVFVPGFRLCSEERKREFDSDAGFGFAPDAEVGADVCGSFAHDG
jgi:hypothetical protein